MPPYGPGWKPSRCTLRPLEVASRCRVLGGLSFLDSALLRPDEPAISIVAAAPFEIIEGDCLQTLEKSLGSEVLDESQMLAVGTFRYEGGHRFSFYHRAAVYDHLSRQWWQRGELLDHLPEAQIRGEFVPLEFREEMDCNTYCKKVEIAQEYIAAGDIYQVNLARRFTAAWHGDAMAFYERLRRLSPKPYAAFLEGEKETVFCASPELFLDIRGCSITTRPIKGTRPRATNPGLDRLSSEELQASAKEAAELLMITDLERNDLGRVCETGSITVPELMRLETYEQVFHLVSTVTGRLAGDVTPLAAVRACFPGGSITGAPKKRAMEIIRELEPVPRGIYTGAIGCFGLGDRSAFNIAIRTAVLSKEKLHFHVGAGIVADSIPEREYEETLHKAAGLLAAAGHEVSLR